VTKRAGPLLLLLLALGCPHPPRQVVYDLIERMSVADRWSPDEVILFGTPASKPHEAEGFYRDTGDPHGDRFAWAKQEAEVSLTWEEVFARVGLLDIAAFRGIKEQRIEVFLNGKSVERFALDSTRRRHRLSLPTEAQRIGENRIRFVFGDSAAPSEVSPESSDSAKLAAAFFSLTIGKASEAGLEDLLRRDAPPPFSVESAGGSRLIQVGPSVVRYGLRLPTGAEIRFSPELHEAARLAGGAAMFRVTLEDRPGEEREIWSRVIRAQDPKSPELRIGIPGKAGAVVRLALHVGSVSSARLAWGVWTAPRVLGGDAGGPLEEASRVVQQDPRRDPPGPPLSGMNVILVILDAARAREFGCYGYSRATTPEIDRVASEGVVFEEAFTPAVYTLAAMASLWTSQHPDQHGVITEADKLGKSRLTLADVLTSRGIRTAGFVANAMAGATFGLDKGFEDFEEVYKRFPDLGSRAAAFTRILPAWLAKQEGRPFFAYLHFREPHFPYDPAPPFNTRFGPDAPLSVEQRRNSRWYVEVNRGLRRASPEQIDHLVRLYDGNLASADAEVGALRKLLEVSGLWERTILVITADHGEQLHEHGYISHSAQVYDESMHVPLILRLPKGPGRLRIKGLVDLLDVAPTVLDCFGLPQDSARSFQGRSLFGRIAGSPGKGAVFSRTVWWDRPVYALRDENFKLIYDAPVARSELYDLGNDIRERRDLARSDLLRTAYYRETLNLWVQRQRAARTGKAETPRPTPEQCENFRALNYVNVPGC